MNDGLRYTHFNLVKWFNETKTKWIIDKSFKWIRFIYGNTHKEIHTQSQTQTHQLTYVQNTNSNSNTKKWEILHILVIGWMHVS